MANSSGLQPQSLQEIAEYHQDAGDSLRGFFSPLAVRVNVRYLFSTEAELSTILAMRLAETELRSCFAILSLIEAVLRVDYATRCSARLKDPLSRDFRNLFKRYGNRISFEEDILRLWSEHHPELKREIGELRGAFRFRHWLAHGRYWAPKLGRKYDFTEVFLLAVFIKKTFRWSAAKIAAKVLAYTHKVASTEAKRTLCPPHHARSI